MSTFLRKPTKNWNLSLHPPTALHISVALTDSIQLLAARSVVPGPEETQQWPELQRQTVLVASARFGYPPPRVVNPLAGVVPHVVVRSSQIGCTQPHAEIRRWMESSFLGSRNNFVMLPVGIDDRQPHAHPVTVFRRFEPVALRSREAIFSMDTEEIILFKYLQHRLQYDIWAQRRIQTVDLLSKSRLWWNLAFWYSCLFMLIKQLRK